MNYTTNDSLKKYTVLLQRHVDSEGNNVCEEINNELKQVIDREILLEQIPHPHLGLTVIYPEKNTSTGEVKNIVLKEIDIKEPMSKPDQIKVDYDTGKIILHHSLEGKYLIVNYWGLGYNLIHSSRVYTKLDENGNVVQTLEDLIKSMNDINDNELLVSTLQDIINSRTSIDNIKYNTLNERIINIEKYIKKISDEFNTLNIEVEG